MQTLNDRFDISRELGRGGMATVYLAHDRQLDREVAVKMLSPELSADDMGERFRREIRVTARLVHPGIVAVFDSGSVGGQQFYVMPFVSGMTLRSYTKASGVLTPDEVTALARNLAEALAYAHGQGVVHRDIKPENIFCHEGRHVLADFGIAKIRDTRTGRVATALTSVGMVIGTIGYMSPEQSLGEDEIDARCDLYSLGCVLFETLTGRLPFVETSPMALIKKQLSVGAPAVRSLRADTPDALADIIDRLLETDVDKRPASAAEILVALRDAPLISGERDTVRLPAPRQAPLSGAEAAVEEGRVAFNRAVQGGIGVQERIALARGHFTKAFELDPRNADAVVGLSDCFLLEGVRRIVPREEAFARGDVLRDQALAMAPDSSDLHSLIGMTFLYIKDDFEEAGRHFERAVQLAPANSMAHKHRAAWLKIAGRFEESLVLIRKAVRMDSKAAFYRVGEADTLMALGRNEEAIEPLYQAIRLQPAYQSALERLVLAAHRAGRHEEALDATRSLLGLRGKLERLAELDADMESHGYGIARENDLRRELTELLAQAETTNPFEDLTGSRQLSDAIIITLTELGEWQRAMDWVERAFHSRPGRLRRVLADLPFDRHGLAVDSRYARVLRMAGLRELM